MIKWCVEARKEKLHSGPTCDSCGRVHNSEVSADAMQRRVPLRGKMHRETSAPDDFCALRTLAQVLMRSVSTTMCAQATVAKSHVSATENAASPHFSKQVSELRSTRKTSRKNTCTYTTFFVCVSVSEPHLWLRKLVNERAALGSNVCLFEKS